jgi:hypothetical protein
MHDNAEPDETVAVRAATAPDAEHIKALAIGNGMFEPDTMSGFDEGLNGYLDGSMEGHRWVVATAKGGQLQGAAYYAPEPFGDRAWNLVHPPAGRQLASTVQKLNDDLGRRPIAAGPGSTE